jgi:hypothetical protein
VAIPLDPDWRKIVLTLRRRHGSYHAVLDQLADRQDHLCDHSTLAYLGSGKTLAPKWRLGAALFNLYTEISGRIKPYRKSGGRER